MKTDRQVNIFNMRLKQMIEELNFTAPSELVTEKEYALWETQRHVYLSQILVSDMQERTLKLQSLIYSNPKFVFRSSVLSPSSYDDVVNTIKIGMNVLDNQCRQKADELIEALYGLLTYSKHDDTITWHTGSPEFVRDTITLTDQTSEPIPYEQAFNLDDEKIPDDCRKAAKSFFTEQFKYDDTTFDTFIQILSLKDKVNLDKHSTVGVFFLVCSDLKMFKANPNYADFVRALIGMSLLSHDRDVKKTADGAAKIINNCKMKVKNLSPANYQDYNLLLGRLTELH